MARSELRIALTPFAPLTDAEMDAVKVAAQRYSDFLGMSLTLA